MRWCFRHWVRPRCRRYRLTAEGSWANSLMRALTLRISLPWLCVWRSATFRSAAASSTTDGLLANQSRLLDIRERPSILQGACAHKIFLSLQISLVLLLKQCAGSILPLDWLALFAFNWPPFRCSFFHHLLHFFHFLLIFNDLLYNDLWVWFHWSDSYQEFLMSHFLVAINVEPPY